MKKKTYTVPTVYVRIIDRLANPNVGVGSGEATTQQGDLDKDEKQVMMGKFYYMWDD